MGEIVKFKNGQKIAFYTQNFIYSGILEKEESMVEKSGFWLSDVSIFPIAGQIAASQVLQTDSVCILWNHVVAFGPPVEPESP